jgi:cofilin
LTFAPYSVQIHDDCITAFQDFSRSHGKTKYIIYKIADDKKSVVVDSVGKDQDYEVFRNELADAKDSQGRASPRYAVYDVEYEIPGEGKRCACLQSQLFSGSTPLT